MLNIKTKFELLFLCAMCNDTYDRYQHQKIINFLFLNANDTFDFEKATVKILNMSPNERFSHYQNHALYLKRIYKKEELLILFDYILEVIMADDIMEEEEKRYLDILAKVWGIDVEKHIRTNVLTHSGVCNINVFNRDIVLIDVIDFSLLKNEEQYQVIRLLTLFLKQILAVFKVKADVDDDEFITGFVPTGDGFYIILNESIPGHGLILALNLKHYADSIADMDHFKGIKIAVHHGGVMPFNDITGKVNFIGDGFNSCNRILSLNEKKIAQKGLSDFYSKGYTVASLEAIEKFEELYKNTPHTITYSDPFFVEDKHGLKHAVKLCEAKEYLQTTIN